MAGRKHQTAPIAAELMRAGCTAALGDKHA